MNREFFPFIKLLLQKVEELNFKVRDETQQNLIRIFKSPKLDEGKIVDSIMEIVEKGPQPAKAPERIILGRLELLLLLLQQIGIRDKPTWDYIHVMNELVLPSLLNQKSDVRWMAQQVISVFFQIKGDTVRDIVHAGCQRIGVRQNIYDSVMKRLSEQPATLDAEREYNHAQQQQQRTNLNRLQPIDEGVENRTNTESQLSQYGRGFGESGQGAAGVMVTSRDDYSVEPQVLQSNVNMADAKLKNQD